MIIMKYIWKILIVAFCIVISSLSFGYTLNTWPKKPGFNPESVPAISDKNVDNINEWWKSFSDKLYWILRLPEKWDYSTSLWYVTTLIQVIINWLLWILAFVALVYMLYCGFLVLLSWADDKNASKGKKGISTAAIALAWIWLSWLIISAMIWFINVITKAN
jgi:hypothetical protein